MRLLHSSMSKAILGDASGIVRLEIWGPAAKQHVEKLTAADAAEGHALVTLVNAEVVGRSDSKQLQCLPKGNRGDYAAIGRARSIEPGWH